MTSDRDRLVGAWAAAAPSERGPYPDELELDVRGIYHARRRDGGFSLWDAGSWEVAGKDRLRVSTANDAIVEYRYALEGEELVIRDDAGLELRFRRR